MRIAPTSRRLGLLGVLLLAPALAQSHHSFFGRFDRQSMIEVEGDVVDLIWRNPHAYFTLRSRDPAGAPVDWEVETSSLSVMRRLGIADGTIKVGDHLRIAGFPPVTEKKEIYVRHVLLPDGRELLMDTDLKPRWSDRTVGQDSVLSIREGDPSRPDLGIFRIWSFVRSAHRLFPEAVDPTFDVQSYPMTDAARAALADFDLANQNPTGRCMPKGMPTVMEQPYPLKFEQRADGNIVLELEEYDLERTIYMRPETAPRAPEPTPLGFSLGRWDGTALVVTTTRVSWPFFSQVGIPQSEAVEIVERFAPTGDGSRLDYEVTVTDPATFTEPVNLHAYWIWIPEVELLPYECALRSAEAE